MNKENIVKQISKDIAGFRELMPTLREEEILMRTSILEGTGSNEISRLYDISMESASVTLLNLFNKGYLRRKKLNHPLGGRYYQYYLIRK